MKRMKRFDIRGAVRSLGSVSVGLLLVSIFYLSASAVMKDRDPSPDTVRFGLNRPEPAWNKQGPSVSKPATIQLQGFQAQGVKIQRHSQTGAVTSLYGRLSAPRPGAPELAATAFLVQSRDLLGIDPSNLRLDMTRLTKGEHHLLFQQTYNGLPVEFSRVKVHLSAQGSVLGLNSGYIYGLSASATPGITRETAATLVAMDLQASPPRSGDLVYLPIYATGEIRLAWKFKVPAQHALWYYYVDAQTGQILFRYNDLRFQCATSGTVMGKVYDLYPSSTPVAFRPVADQEVYVFSNSTPVVTAADGSYCSQTTGKIFAGLQGPNARVAHFNLASVHYDNGGGVWFTAATPVATPNPYPNGTAEPNSEVFSQTINSPASPGGAPFNGGPVVKAMPYFSSFNVGESINGDIFDDDQVYVADANGVSVGNYMGNKSAFMGAAIHGFNPLIRLRLMANPSGQASGFAVSISSFLVLTNAPSSSATVSNIVWSSTMTSDGQPDEINVFYHINKMHDYFMADVNKSSAAFISLPAVAMVHVGPSLLNAFYNPDHDSFAFGDAAAFALDATVIHHEYTHYVVDKIFPVINFGQFGAISEANADYFALSSLNISSIGGGVGISIGEASLRDLNCPVGSGCFKKFPDNWTGEIHDDSLPLSQALWEVRTAAGAACADQLVFQSLFYFPDSFQEFLDAMLEVNARGVTLAPSCASSQQSTIVTAFSNHGITGAVAGADGYEPNDGIQSATNISTLSIVSATIYPAADLDYFTFGAGSGMIRAALSLPANPIAGGTYFPYSLFLFDRNFNELGGVIPTVDAGCTNSPDGCTTSSQVRLDYNNPGANQFYLLVSAALASGYVSAVNSQVAYQLRVEYPQSYALTSSIVNASYDNDLIQFSVNVATFVRIQNYSFSYAQLRDQGLGVLPQTATNGVSPYLTFVSSSGTLGNISGILRIASGFAARFPAAATVYLEIFGLNQLQSANQGSGDPYVAHSLGLSNPINLTTNRTELTAWNNIFNPAKGQKATFQYQVAASGHVQLRLYTMSGILVRTLLDEDVTAGKGSVDWYGTNTGGQTVASGIYLLHLSAPGISKTQKVIVVK